MSAYRVWLQMAVASMLLLVAGTALAQTCVSSIPDSSPASRYQMNVNGTVVDLQTGLVWARCSEGQTWDAQQSTCTGVGTVYTWKGALAAVQALDQSGGFAGYTDWRLPNFRELTSLTRYRCHNPAINLAAFPNTPSAKFWTSTPVAAGYGTEWAVDFTTGQAVFSFYSDTYPIRLVRAGAFAP